MNNTHWLASGAMENFYPGLQRDLSTDVLVIGGGITGLTAAYLLSQKGRRVTVVDACGLGEGETGRTTAHLTTALDYGYDEIERMHGLAAARTAFQSHRDAIDLIEATASGLGADCEFSRVDGYVFLGAGEKRSTLDLQARAFDRVGAQGLEVLDRAPVQGFETGPCLRLPGQAQFHPIRYLSALALKIASSGGRFYTHTHVESIASGHVFTDDGCRIEARHIIVATHSPVKNVLFFLKEAAYRSYVVACAVPKGSITRALYWDTEDPYHYVRLADLDASHDLLIVGGEDHKTGQNSDYQSCFEKLELWTRKRFPFAGKTQYRWSGQVVEPVDGLPYVGKSPYHKDIWIATGYSGNGITGGTMAGMLLTDLIMGTRNERATLYSPTRKNLPSSLELAKENLNVMQKFVGDRLKKADDVPAEDLSRGEGAVIQRGTRKIAAYCDAEGKVTECSAVCPHLGCIVQWNSAERSFDCPCHGSRFSGEGKVLSGPAIRDLKKTLSSVEKKEPGDSEEHAI
jgi:glycine/D-amino acid oxidase-like deaminating enzyme/nitrite reductase/ring-hydroxylating ferredoxin subunit